MNIEEITTVLEQLEAGQIDWEQALRFATSLPTAWQTTEWKQLRDSLIGQLCAVCATTTGPFVLQHLVHCDTFKEMCGIVRGELERQLAPQVASSILLSEVEEHIGPGAERLACPACGSLTIRQRRGQTPPYICGLCDKYKRATREFETPLPVRYYAKQRTTNRDEALKTAYEFMVSVALFKESRQYDQAIQHEATRRCLHQSLLYRSLKHTATYCKKCAFKEDLPVIQRKIDQ